MVPIFQFLGRGRQEGHFGGALHGRRHDRLGAGKFHLVTGKSLVKNGDGADHPAGLLGILENHKDAADEQGFARFAGPAPRQPGIQRHQAAPERRIHQIHGAPLRLI